MAPGPIPSPVATVMGPSICPESQLSYMMTPRSTMSITHTKGLLNMPGQNNCFLNSAVQVLWHLDIFRRSFRDLSRHACMAESCIFCALKELFTQFQYSQESALPPDALRRALAETFFDQRRFQLGFMDDAAECFENILLRIHFHIANQETEDMCCAPHCIPHQKFAMTLVEQTVCHACGATSEPLPFTQMVHYVSASALSSQASNLMMQSDGHDVFGELLKRAGGMGDIRECPSSCGAKVHIRRTLINRPDIVSIGLVWDSERPTLDHIMDVFHAIGTTMKLQDVFHSVVDARWAAATTHQLVGIVTYYGKHYSTFFFHTKLRVWIYFDDAAVREIGPCWEQVIDKCRRGHFQPLLLLYANPLGKPIGPVAAQHAGAAQNPENCPENPPVASFHKFGEITSPSVDFYPGLFEGLPKNVSMRRRTVVTPSGELVAKGDEVQCDSKALNLCYKDEVDASWCHRAHVDSANSGCFPYDSVCGCKGHVTHGSTEISECMVRPLSSSKPASLDDLLHTIHKRADDKITTKDVPMKQSVQQQSSCEEKSSNPFDGADSDTTYISRRAVESVLNFQKLQRQRSLSGNYSSGSVGNRNSSSSLESFENTLNNRDKLNAMHHLLKKDVCLLKRRDSGNWSGDRNSASSSSSTSLDAPFSFTIGNRRLLANQRPAGGLLGGPNNSQGSRDYTNVGSQSADQGYDSFSLSSTDSFPSPVKVEPRLSQIPENLQSAVFTMDANEAKDSRTKAENKAGTKEDCDTLCAEADVYLACSHQKEQGGDLVMAALLSDTAAAKARAAMDAPYSNPQSLISAKMKHSLCVMRSSNLHRRLKEANAEEKRRQKEAAAGEGHHSRQSSRDSTHGGRHSRQGSKDGKEYGKHSTLEGIERLGSSIEIYATLPKKMGKKKMTSQTVSSTGQLYQDFIDKQKKNSQEALSLKKPGAKFSQVDELDKKWAKNSKITSENVARGHTLTMRGLISPKTVQETNFSALTAEWEPKKKPTLCRTQSVTSASKGDYDGIAHYQNIGQLGKKQHKIRRKLMGGLMRRKNRSLPDLREGQDASESLSSSFDDGLALPAKPLTPRLIKKECIVPASGATQTRGFHQPHRAFVNKDLYQRPLLTKVNPPLVEPPSHITTNKPSTLPSELPNVSNKADDAATLSYILHSPNPDLPPKAPSYSLVQVPGAAESTKSHFTYDTPMEDFHQPNNKVAKEDPINVVSAPSTTKFQGGNFLAELQAKQKTITGESGSSDVKIKEDESCSSQPAVSQVHDSGNTWLRELQTKQLQMLQRRRLTSNSSAESLAENESLQHNQPVPNNPVPRSTVQGAKGPEMVSEAQPLQPNPKHHAPSSIYNASLSHNTSESKEPNSRVQVLEGVKPQSVKDLASRFEQILKSSTSSETNVQTALPHENIQANKVQEYNNAVHHSSQLTGFAYNSEKGAPTQMHNAEKNDHTTKHLNQSRCQLKSDQHLGNGSLPDRSLTPAFCARDQKKDTSTFPVSRTVPPPQHFSTAFVSDSERTELRRPDRPPDYETAIQRLGMIRDRSNCSTPVDGTLLGKQELQLVPPSAAQIDDMSKKKRGPKKTVTFSDQVVLVACADDEDTEFIPNPLLERVYKQHLMQHVPGSVDEQTNGIESCCAQSSDPIRTATQKSVAVPCHLCNKKDVTPPTIYCPDCAFYMSRFQPRQ